MRRKPLLQGGFYEVPVFYNGLTFRNNEAAFQSQKTMNETKRKEFTFMNPSQAKRAGRHVFLRNDWENVKFQIMEDIVRAKFSQNPDLKDLLLATGSEELIEGNNWGDKVWGMVDGVGENNLGKILMKIRNEFR